MIRLAVTGPIVAVSLMLMGSATTGPPKLASCLSDRNVMAQFHAHPSPGKTSLAVLLLTGKRCAATGVMSIMHCLLLDGLEGLSA